MTNLLITGSRRATPEMVRYAGRAVARAGELGWVIVVGDADGVDTAVINACHQTNTPFSFWGIEYAPRNYCCSTHLSCAYQQFEQQQGLSIRDSYLARDKHMVNLADRCLAICRNRSGGTMYTYGQAVKRGIPADLKEFK